LLLLPSGSSPAPHRGCTSTTYKLSATTRAIAPSTSGFGFCGTYSYPTRGREREAARRGDTGDTAGVRRKQLLEVNCVCGKNDAPPGIAAPIYW
jgi:hypothetical protein